MISIQSITRQDLQYSYCTAIFVVLMCDDEAKESFAIVLTTSRCHFDEMVTAHRNEVWFPTSVASLARPRTAFWALGPLIQGITVEIRYLKQIFFETDIRLLALTTSTNHMQSCFKINLDFIRLSNF